MKQKSAQVQGATTLSELARDLLTARWVRWLTLLLLCSAYIEGGINKAADFDGAIAEMTHFGVSPAAPMAAIVIALELGGSLLILVGRFRWLGALALGGFTFLASLLASAFWDMPPGHDRFMAENTFFEHLGLVGGFILVAWHDLAAKPVDETDP